jgi:type I restriction enzyme S subunit
MKHALERYDAYKDSGVEWLNEIPQHWRIERVKNLTKTQSGTTPQSGTSEYYENGTNFWVRTTDLNNDRLYSSEYQITDFALNHCGLKSIPVNSVLLAMYGGMGTIGKNSILKEKVTINQSVCAVLPHAKRFDSTYFWYYIQYFRPHWEMYADSARKDPNINQEAVKRLWVAIPPLPEQQAIADYLNTKIEQIDRKIDLLTQKATQYGKLKQSLINETVTRGLDKSVAMKDSGVEWIGEVPEHWKVKRLKDYFFLISSGIDYFKGTKEYLSTKSISINKIEKIEDIITYEKKPSRANMQPILNSVWFAKLRFTKKNYLFDTFDEINKYILSTGFAGLKPKKGHSIFSNYFISSEYFLYQKDKLSYGTTQEAITEPNINQIIFICPEKEEKIKIANYLDEKTSKIDKIISKINNQIETLGELRKTLINDVVTGKIKVPQ